MLQGKRCEENRTRLFNKKGSVLEQATLLNLLFTLGYKSDAKIKRITSGIRDFPYNNVSRFVYELSAFNEFECPRGALDFSEPTDIIAGFSLERDASSHLFTEGNLDYSIAVNSFGINIRISVYDGATCHRRPASVRPDNSIGKRQGSIRPCDRQAQGA